jgi:hypothetical protein
MLCKDFDGDFTRSHNELPVMKDGEEVPAMSVILACSGRFDEVAATLRHLQKQTVAARLEVLILAPAPGFALPDGMETSFHTFRFITLETLLPLGAANAEGVRHAAAPIVAFIEDHVFPDPDWAQALIARHAEDWAAVAPVVRNANPKTAVSSADFLVGYGQWQEGTAAGEMSILPGHNCSYKRAVLLRQGDKLSHFLHAESVLHTTLTKNGDRLFLENRAIISHLNFAQLGTLLFLQFHHGRQYAGRRIWNWPLAKRLLFFGGAPLIPFVRLKRILGNTRQRVRLPILFVLFLDLLVDGAGQALGYATGVGRSEERLRGYDYDRRRFLSPRDRSALQSQEG